MRLKSIETDILFSGYYGHKNTGDDAFVEVASWGAEKYWNKKNIIFLGRKTGLPVVSRKVRGFPFEIPKTYSLQSRILLSSTDCLLSAGGSTLHTEMKKNNIKRLAMEKKRRGGGVKIGGIGVSVGPFKTVKDERSVFDYLKNLDFLAVRDQASFDIVKGLDLPYKPVNAFDLAALLPDIYGLDKTRVSPIKRKVIGVSVCPYESIVNQKEIQRERYRDSKMISLLKSLDKQGDIHFRFFVFNGHPSCGDLKLTTKTIGEVDPSSYDVVNYNKETRAVWDHVTSCDFVVSTRLHAAIFACFSNTPFLLNEYHRKCSDFLESISYDQERRVGDGNFDPKEKAKYIVDILNGDKPYLAPKKISEMRERAKLNFTGVNF